MNDDIIEQASLDLHTAVAEAVRLVGRDVARSLLIHYLHIVDSGDADPAPAKPAA